MKHILQENCLVGLNLIANTGREICLYKAGPDELINEKGRIRYFDQWKKRFEQIDHTTIDDPRCA